MPNSDALVTGELPAEVVPAGRHRASHHTRPEDRAANLITRRQEFLSALARHRGAR